ncbi:hypothetical protein, partial [Myroides albus]|uniref:hypothetical protein n=1 Tax=Myroides albus TaxID=2562892 RepID=UPI001E502656
KAGALPTELLPHFVRANIKLFSESMQFFLKKISRKTMPHKYHHIIKEIHFGAIDSKFPLFIRRLNNYKKIKFF